MPIRRIKRIGGIHEETKMKGEGIHLHLVLKSTLSYDASYKQRLRYNQNMNRSKKRQIGRNCERI